MHRRGLGNCGRASIAANRISSTKSMMIMQPTQQRGTVRAGDWGGGGGERGGERGTEACSSWHALRDVPLEASHRADGHAGCERQGGERQHTADSQRSHCHCSRHCCHVGGHRYPLWPTASKPGEPPPSPLLHRLPEAQHRKAAIARSRELKMTPQVEHAMAAASAGAL